MNLSFATILLLVSCLFLFFDNISAENFSSRRRRTKELEEKINNLDDGTKQRIYAMKASGMPREAIAEKISYVAGGKQTAKRIVDALHDEPPKKTNKYQVPPQRKQQAPTTPTSSTTARKQQAPTTPTSSTTAKAMPTTSKFNFGKR
jgi:hypothetical protein